MVSTSRGHPRLDGHSNTVGAEVGITNTEALHEYTFAAEQPEQHVVMTMLAGEDTEVSQEATKRTETEGLPIPANELDQEEQIILVIKIPGVTGITEVSQEAIKTKKKEQTVLVDMVTVEITMQCNRCRYKTEGYKGGQLKTS